MSQSFSSLPPVLASGTAADTADMKSRFTGSQLDLAIVPDSPEAPGAAEASGPEHMIVRLPSQKSGRSEPLVVTGRTSKGDFIYVNYEDDGHIRVGFDHWSYGGNKSGPLAVDYQRPARDLDWARIDVPAGGRRCGLGRRRPFRTPAPAGQPVRLCRWHGGAFLCRPSPTPRRPARSPFARNTIGGSTCDADFSGTVEFSEREGPAGRPPTGR